jgi:CubicO group peptidase (beta-lactamase class C family)
MLRAVAAHLQPQPAAASESEGLEEPPPKLDQNTPPPLSAALRADIAARGSAAVDELILASMATAEIPAVSVSIVKRGEVAWAKTFGLANVERHIPATTDTIFGLASVTKTVTAVAVMQLYEAGLV